MNTNQAGHEARAMRRELSIARGLLLFALLFLAMRVQAVQPFVKTIQATGPNSFVQVQVMKTDEDGSVWTAGIYSGTATFTSALRLGPVDRPAVFLAKQDPSGGWSSAKQAFIGVNISDSLIVRDIDISDTLVCLGGEHKPNSGERHGFVLLQSKLNFAGNPLVKILQGVAATGEYASVSRIGLDASNNVYVGGKFSGHMTDGTRPLTGVPHLPGVAFDQDIFVFKFNSALVSQWSVKAGSSLQWIPFAARANGLLEDVAGLKIDAEGNILLVLNVAGMNFLAVDAPVSLYNFDSTVARRFYTGYVGPFLVPPAMGALMPMAAKLSSSGVWNIPGSLEFNTQVDRPASTTDTVYNAPATDMVLSGGKIYVAGTYRNAVGTHSYLMRVGVDTLLPDGPVCYLKSATSDGTIAKRVTAQGSRVFLTGTMGRTLREYRVTTGELILGQIDKETTSIQANEFIAGFDLDMNPQWARTSTRPNEELVPSSFSGAALAYDGTRRVVFWGGYFNDSTRRLFLGEEENPVALGPVSVQTGWLAALQDTDTGTYREQVRLLVNSAFGPITVNNVSFPVTTLDNTYLRDTLITVGVPPQFPEALTTNDNTRQRCTGFRLDGTVVSGDATTYTFPLTVDSTFTFNWQTEHKLTIDSNHAQAGLNAAAAAGSAEPPIGISWIRQDELVNAFIDGYVKSFSGRNPNGDSIHRDWL